MSNIHDKEDNSKAVGDHRSETTAGKSSFAPPAINLPKGGGAISGMGEKFATNPVTGTGSLTVPLSITPGRYGFSPQLALSYDSGKGNGPFGFGWSLSLPAITRKTDKSLPLYRDAKEARVCLRPASECGNRISSDYRGV